AGCMATVTFTQPSSAQAKPGSSITLDCVVSGYNINDHHLSWIRQAPGKSLVWLAAFRTGYTTYIADEFKGRCVTELTLTRPSSAQAEPGSSLTLDCVVSGYNINDRHRQQFRLPQGKSLVWLAAFRTGYTAYITDEFKGRVTPSTSSSTARLKTDRLTAADTATYYHRCTVVAAWLPPRQSPSWNWPPLT
ncbi:unnamed protein product, partial [Natator depressus]